MSRTLLALPLATVLVVALTACGGQSAPEDTAPAPTTATTTPEVTPTPTPTPVAEVDPVAAYWDDIVTFVQATHVGDIDAALPMTAEGSPAAEYVAYLKDSFLAQQAAGYDPHAYDDGFSFDPDKDEQLVDVSFRDTTGTGSDPQDYTWSNFEVTDAGKIESWTGASGPIGDVLGKDHDTKEAKGQTITVAHAYKANSGVVWVILKVDSTVNAYPDYAPIYVGPDGVARKPVQENTMELVEDATSYLSYAYEGADFGGKMKYAVDFDTPITLTIS